MYLSHRGWAAAHGSPSWLAYRLKKTTSLPAALGVAVHEAFTYSVREVKAGRAIPSADALRLRCATTLNAIWASSRLHVAEFLERPSGTPMFEDRLYDNGPRREALLRARRKLDRAVCALAECYELWSLVRSADPEDVLIMDPFYRFALPGEEVTCYAAADLIVRPHPDAPWHIVDVKTSDPHGVIDQVLTYAVAARDGLCLAMPGGCRGVVVSLDAPPSARYTDFEVTLRDIDDSLARIRANVRSMRALLVDVEANEPRPLDAFPPTANRGRCARCRFRALCYPTSFPLTVSLGARG